MTGVHVDDIIDASFVNLVHIVPFYVVKLEREGRKELVIAVRGTLSIKVRSGGCGYCGWCEWALIVHVVISSQATND